MAEPHFSALPDIHSRGPVERTLSELRALAASFVVRSSGSFSVFGRRYDAASGESREGQRLTNAARDLLADVLYVTMHCRQDVSTSTPTIVPRLGYVDDSSFAARLSNANTGTGSWHAGWALRAENEHGTIAVERGGLRLWASREDFAPDNSHSGLGATGRLRFPKEYVNLYPGYYVALGNAHRGQREGGLRLYWNVTADGAAHLVGRLTHALNEASVDFQLKILNSSARFDRTDAAILYVPRDAWPLVRERVALVHEAVTEQLKSALSAYVLPLAPGLGLAEDPIEHVSFGQNRSRILAASLAATSEAGDVLESLLCGIENAGLDVGRFYANPGSRHEYRL